MPAYWWECEECSTKYEFGQVCPSRGMPHYIRDFLVPSNWDQDHLLINCPDCGNNTLHIAYEFPRKEKESIRVIHIVGLGTPGDEYIPMMWETSPAPHDGNNWFDFKYINGRNVFGLNKPAVFHRSDLRMLFNLYSEKTGSKIFP